jgi:hypothetical protein
VRAAHHSSACITQGAQCAFWFSTSFRHDARISPFLGDLAVDHRKAGVVQQIDEVLA